MSTCNYQGIDVKDI